MDAKALTTESAVDFLKTRGIEISKRQAHRLFAERKFPRFFVGHKQYVLSDDLWTYITNRSKRG